MKLRLIVLPVLLVLVLAFLLPFLLWQRTGQAWWLLLIPAVIFSLLYILLKLALWGSNGGLGAVIDGRRDPEPKQFNRVISSQSIDPALGFQVKVMVDTDQPLAAVSERFLSFAIDTSQVVGGKWWNPDSDMVEYGSGSFKSPVFDFTRPKLNGLTNALAPAYLRIGGSEADKVYYDMDDEADAVTLTSGFESVFTPDQWDAAIAFAHRNDLKLVFTLNCGPGTRTYEGHWDPKNTIDLMRYTKKKGYQVDVWELGNEMNVYFSVHGVGEHVPPPQYCQDLRIARTLVDKNFPDSKLAGQGSAFWPVLGEPLGYFFGYLPEYLERAGKYLDIATWHYYPQQSHRGPFVVRKAAPSRLLESKNLDESAYWASKIKALRDDFSPDASLWLGETGNAQFGGEPGVSDAYIGGLWWLDQLGLMARTGHDVVVRQSLTGMNYGLLDEDTLEPRPDYWNSLLWKRLMGEQVYAAKTEGSNSGKLRVYVHGAVTRKDDQLTILGINLDHERPAKMILPQFAGRRYETFHITTPNPLSTTLMLNGEPLELGDYDSIPEFSGVKHSAQETPVIELNPLSYVFVRVG